jgi:hypothetical protein
MKQDAVNTPVDSDPEEAFTYPEGAAQTEAEQAGNAEAETENGPTYETGEATALATSVAVADDEIPVMRIESPWAVDADGTALPTQYSVRGNTLEQVVDTRGAVFPVVADPVFIPILISLTVTGARVAAPAIARAFAAKAIKKTATASVKGGHKTFNAFKKSHVTGKEKTHDWHHVVEQSNIKRHSWDARSIHNKKNMIQIPRKIHQKCINSQMASKNVSFPGFSSGPYNTMRSLVKTKSWAEQYRIGVLLLIYCGVKI